MSGVLARKRNLSKLEVIVFASQLHDMMLEFMQRSFGIRNLNNVLRNSQRCLNFVEMDYVLQQYKHDINEELSFLETNLRAANTIYPTTASEYERRREFQTIAITNCECVIGMLQRIADIFDVDINKYEKPITAIRREISLIKKWRQSDNKLARLL